MALCKVLLLVVLVGWLLQRWVQEWVLGPGGLPLEEVAALLVL